MYKIEPRVKFALNWQVFLSDYITGLAWSPSGEFLAASSASGEVAIWKSRTDVQVLLTLSDGAIDCLGFCHDGRFFAVAGQDGQVKIWESSPSGIFSVYHTIDYHSEHPSIWIDRLAWHPSSYLVAFNLGKQVQVWDLKQCELVTVLDFAESTISDLAWSPDGLLLTVGGKNCLKSWDARDWLLSPKVLKLSSPSLVIAWSKDSKYLASGNQDNSVIVDANTPDPWEMTGFPSKIRQVVWSDCNTKHETPLLAVASANGAAVWIKENDQECWQCWLLDLHQDMVRAIAFQPNSLLLATTSDDGWLCLWHEAVELTQILKQEVAFCNLAWHPQGDQLVIGSESGEIFVYSM